MRWVRPDLTTSGELVGLGGQGVAEAPQSGEQVLSHGGDGGEVDGGGDDVVGRLAEVDLVVGMDRPTAPSSNSVARPAMTSLALVLVEVPDPVWKMSSGNWSSSRPSRTSSAAAAMASA